MTHSKNRPRSFALRIPTRPYEPGEQAWYDDVDRQADAFSRERAATIRDPGACLLVLRLCADLTWEWREGQPAWATLQIAQLWERLRIQTQFFPQPALVVAFYETLWAFLPWLVSRGALGESHKAQMLAELEQVKSPLLDSALAMIAMRGGRAREPITQPAFRVPS